MFLCGESVCEECVGLGWVAGAGACAAHAAQDLLKTGSRRRPWWSRAPRKCDPVHLSMSAVTRGLLGVLGYLTQHSPRVCARPVRVCVCFFFLTQHRAPGVRPAGGFVERGWDGFRLPIYAGHQNRPHCVPQPASGMSQGRYDSDSSCVPLSGCHSLYVTS